MCHESSGAALIEAIGIGKGSVTVDDVVNADLIIIAGRTRHQSSAHALDAGEGKGQRGQDHCGQSPAGSRADPLQGSAEGARGGRQGSPIADEFVQIRLGGDMALFAGLGRLLLEADDRAPGTVVDREFVDNHCANSRSTKPRPAASASTPCWGDGYRRAQLDRVAKMMIESDRTILCWAMGLTQHRHAVATIGDHQRAVHAWHDRQARCRVVPRARSLECAG